MALDIFTLAPLSFWICAMDSPPLPIMAPAAIDGTKILRWMLSKNTQIIINESLLQFNSEKKVIKIQHNIYFMQNKTLNCFRQNNRKCKIATNKNYYIKHYKLICNDIPKAMHLNKQNYV